MTDLSSSPVLTEWRLVMSAGRGKLCIAGPLSGHAFVPDESFVSAAVIEIGGDVKAWAMKIARHRGMKKAIVALARRLAVIMHRIWVDGTEFRWTREAAAA